MPTDRSSAERIVVSRDGANATVLIDRADKRNCLDLPMWRALGGAFDSLSGDTSLRCVVVRGAGTEAFSAGADVVAFQHERGTPEKERIYADDLHDAFQAIRRCIHPVVAAISGWCMGGGCGIATMCDFRVGGESARMGIPARNLGIWYQPAELDPILQTAGYAICCELLIEGRVFTGREAHDKHLLTRVVPDAAVFEEAYALAARIAEGAPLSARFHKRALQALRGPYPLSPEQEQAGLGFSETEDFRNAVRAFAEKRKPVFQGR